MRLLRAALMLVSTSTSRAFAQAVVAMFVPLLEASTVGAVGVPVKAGDAKGAFNAKASVVALDKALILAVPQAVVAISVVFELLEGVGA